MIHEYQDAVRCAVESLEATGIPRPKSTTDWIGYDVPGTGELATGGKYFIHGFGCAVKTPEFCVDFDFGEHGEIDGIDFHRMENFARNHLQTKYGFADSAELHSAIKASCDAGEMIDSGYILWYLRPELQGESNQNVNEPSDARAYWKWFVDKWVRIPPVLLLARGPVSSVAACLVTVTLKPSINFLGQKGSEGERYRLTVES